MKRSLPDLEPYLDHLKAIPFVLEVKVGPVPRGLDSHVDGLLVIQTQSGLRKVPFQVKRSHLLRETAGSLVHQARGIPKLLVMAPLVGHDLGQLFTNEKVSYVDLAGNHHINLDDQYISHAQGRTIEKAQAKEKGLRTAAYRAIFALLVDPDLIGQPTRKVAEMAGGLSPQTVNDVRRRLVERGLVLSSQKTFRWTPGRRAEVLDLWLAGFATTLWRSLRIAPLRSPVQNAEELEAQLRQELRPGWAAAY